MRPDYKEGFRVKRKQLEKARRRSKQNRNKIRRQRLENRKRRIERRLENPGWPDNPFKPMFLPGNVQYEVADRARGMTHGGIGVVHKMVEEIGLPDAIDRMAPVLKFYLPYHESDHVLNIAYNALCGGRSLEDIELRRNDEVFLDALGTARIPDPTTAGDFCRRFDPTKIRRLMGAIDESRLKVWARQPQEFFEQAIIDMDGTIVETCGECKEGMDISYNGLWGYHPLIVSLANTQEVLRLVNRSANRPSHEGAAFEADESIALCRRAGFRSILLRGDTDFSQTKHLDRWDKDNVTFIFGMDVTINKHILADDLPSDVWELLQRAPRYKVKTKPRRRPTNVKKEIVKAREFETIRLESEEIAEFKYRPAACKQEYRMIVLCKNVVREKGQKHLFDDYRYFLYITNDWDTPASEIVFQANDRCDQENLIGQLKSGVCSLKAPLKTLNSNWAYMVMTALAWNIKSWWALMLPENPGRWAKRHKEQKRRVLRMHFQTFITAFVQIPCQILQTGRRLIYRVLNWNPWQPVFFRMVDVLRL